eukprot:COSAG05_NODE_4474_length_1498_cov_1.894210_2_plen_201_part_00
MKFNPTVHVSAFGWNTGIGGNTAEYDVPQCPAGTPMEKCTHTISGVVTPPAGDMHFVGAHYHCHAPTCLKMEIYNNVTGELLCREEPYHGQGADITGVDRFVSGMRATEIEMQRPLTPPPCVPTTLSSQSIHPRCADASAAYDRMSQATLPSGSASGGTAPTASRRRRTWVECRCTSRRPRTPRTGIMGRWRCHRCWSPT